MIYMKTFSDKMFEIIYMKTVTYSDKCIEHTSLMKTNLKRQASGQVTQSSRDM